MRRITKNVVGRDDDSSNRAWKHQVYNNYVYFWIMGGGSSVGSTTLIGTAWRYTVSVFDGSTASYTYVDGAEESSDAHSVSNLPTVNSGCSNWLGQHDKP